LPNTPSACTRNSAEVDVIEAQPPGSVDELADHVADLPSKSPEDPYTPAIPYTVKLKRANITTNGVMGSINQGVTNRYVILDLFDCYAANNTISGYGGGSFTPGPNDMNVIKDNRYIVGIILPGELTAIGNYAFDECESLPA
jgi:hypothetical protein